MDMKHAPLPWTAENREEHKFSTMINSSDENKTLRYVTSAGTDDAEFIIRACNAYYDAIEALDACEDYFDKIADAEYFENSPLPVGNEEMTLLCTVQSVLAKMEMKR